MNKCLVFLLLLFPSISFSQKAVLVKVSCGWGAETSQEFSKLQDYLAASNFDLIKNCLRGENPLERLLAAVLLSDLQDSGKIILKVKDQDELKKIRVSNNKYEICYTCTFSEKGTFNQLFSRKQNLAYSLIRNHLFVQRSSNSTSE